MAHLIATTTWSHLKTQGSPFTITLSQSATAGSTLIFTCAGGAIATASGFTKRTTYGGGAQDVSISDFVATGGETSVSVSLNGSGENVSGIIYEFGPGLSFTNASNNGAGATASQSSDFQIAPSAVGISGSSLIIGLWSVSTSSAFSTANSWKQMGPQGVLYANAGNQPGVNFQFIWASGVADVTASTSYPQQLSAGQYEATSVYLSSGTAFTCQAAYSDSSGIATNPAVNPIVAENSLPGTDNGNWYVGSSATDSTIAGFADRCSYATGDTVNFRVDSTSNPFRVEIYRVGFYGWETFGARNVLGNQGGYITGTVTSQPVPSVDGTLGSTSCSNWTTNATWTIPSNAPSGLYYVLFRRTDATTHVSSGHFIVRGSVSGKPTIVLPDTTYQAYNVWGATTDNGTLGSGTWTGRSIYQAGQDGGAPNFAHRAYAVSFDRPYSTQSTQSTTYFTDSEQGVITFLEAQGYNLNYISDMDLQGNPTMLNSASLVIVLGHHEYWSTDMYDAFSHAISTGVNTFIDSSNTAGWHVRFAAGDTNLRTMICYKDSGTADVSAGWSGTGYDPVSYTGTWRDTRQNVGTVNNTDIRRENALTGQLFVASGPITQVMTVAFAYKSFPIWRNSASIQALTSGQSFSTSTNTVGYEVDSANGSLGQPTNLVSLNPTTFSFTSGANAAGTVYSSTVNVPAGFTLYRANSGALIFNTGNWRGWSSVSRWQGSRPSGHSIDLDWQNAFLSILYDLGQTPVTLRSVMPGQDSDVTDPSVGAPGGSRNHIAQAYGLTVAASNNTSFLDFFEF